MTDAVDNVITVEVITDIQTEVVSEVVNTPELLTTSAPELLVEVQSLVELMETKATELISETVPAVEVIAEISTGPQGRPGTPEDEVMYAKRVDMVSDALMYRGEAVVGTAEATPEWRIRRIDIAPDGDVTETWAEGSAAFSFVWVNRAALTYS